MNRADGRISFLAGPLAVALWVAGVLLLFLDGPSEHATGAEILAWYRSHSDRTLAGGWLFMLGCVAFVWFWSALRRRLAGAEGGDGSLATIAFAGGIATAALGLLIPAVDIAGALDKADIDPETAATFHRISDAFFVTAETGAIVPMAAVALLAWRTRVLPRWWAALGALVAVVLAIGPIGWAGLIYGLPVWTLGTTVLLLGRRASLPTAA